MKGDLIKIGIHGASGKMGKEIINIIHEYNNCLLSYKFYRYSDINELCESSDVILDFSHAEATINLLQYAVSHNVPILIGTTGISNAQQEHIIESATKIPILQAPNTSLAIEIIRKFSCQASKILGDKDYDIDIIEMHHSEKKDSPSGTALMLEQEIYTASTIDAKISTIRAGNLYGEHQIMFTGKSDMITMSHRAFSRKCYAEGAIIGGMWIAKQKSGLYYMKDFLLSSCI